ncbi:hypothetical protein PG993_005934 [Apiospora rasikravindrae]|uniref:Protein kinase domain-containing protein n=1 Tax=Apiospora rasikravindrae TaxID=990691 RepID=A0ABR1TCJ5_9PEZI
MRGHSSSHTAELIGTRGGRCFIESFRDGQDFRATITRQELEDICEKCFRSITATTERALASARLAGTHINEVIAAGGSYRIPKLRRMLEDFFRVVPEIRYFNRQEAEVTGLAYMAPLLFNHPQTNTRGVPHRITATVVTPWSIGIGTGNGRLTRVLPRYSQFPANKRILITWECPKEVSSEAPLHVYEGDEQEAKWKLWLGPVDIAPLLPETINSNFKIQAKIILRRDSVPPYPESTICVTKILDGESSNQNRIEARLLGRPKSPGKVSPDFLDEKTIRPQQQASNTIQHPHPNSQVRAAHAEVFSPSRPQSMGDKPLFTQTGMTSSILHATAGVNSLSLDFSTILPRPHQVPTTPYTDMDFERISTYLRAQNHEAWSVVPRLFTVLTLIGRTDALNIFIQNVMDNMWFPFETRTLPLSLQTSTKSQFLNIQKVVYQGSKAHQLGSGAKSHALFDKDDCIPLISKRKLGRGAHGTVDKVISTISYKEYARKLFRKPRVGKQSFETFKTELDVLRRLLWLPGYGRAITARLADPAPRHKAAEHHRQGRPGISGRLRHCVQLWKPYRRHDHGRLGQTQIYAAPEVIRVEPRNEAADIWSLGCVFFEMATVIKGHLRENHFMPRTGSRYFFHNVEHLAEWAELLRNKGRPDDDLAFG